MDKIIHYIKFLFNCSQPIITEEIQIDLKSTIYKSDSTILDLLPFTDFTVSDPIDMINSYELIPIINAELTHSFINIQEDDIDDIIKKSENIDSNNITSVLQTKINYGSNIGYTNLDEILLHTIKAHQLGHNIFNIITPDLIQDIKATINVFASLLFFESYIIPVEDLNKYTLIGIRKYFTLSQIKNRILGYPNLYQIYKSNELSIDLFHMISSIYTLPQKIVVDSEEIILSCRQPFIKNSCRNVIKYNDSILQHINKEIFNIHDILEKYAKNKLTSEFWGGLHKILINNLENIELNLIRLERFRNNVVFGKSIIKFPIYFINCNKRNFKLGNEVKLIATDNEINRNYLKDFFEKYKINCEIILFSQLST